MSTPILATKLYIPPPRPKVVLRPRLNERLNEGLQRKPGVTLISAPAGFGKTTLVGEWLAAPWHRPPGQVGERPAAWLSLDEGDNDLTRFLAYLVAALQTLALPHRGAAQSQVEGIAANIGAGVLAVLQSPQLPPIESILTGLLNEIAALPDDFVLVLDDYHVIEAPPVDRALAFLVEHLPPPMHLVIATREDPHLPLARLRARGQLTELRAADLRFTPAEAAEFLNRVMGLALSAEDIAALETRTEGWIAGLQLAALSMQGHQDAASLIAAFTGSHRFVLDYLLEEVLHQQPASIQAFLLRTSILDRLCGPLCDAVLRDPAAAGQETLAYLEHANLFIVPLDGERRWYRYHHLFADLLRQRLRQSAPLLSSPPLGELALPAPAAQTQASLSKGTEGESVAEYHRRASLWYEENGYEAEAFHHAVAAEDFERAAGLAELAWAAMDRSFQSAAWRGWVKKLPDELIRTRPVLSAEYASALMDAGELEASESRLRDAERWLDTIGDMGARPEGSPHGMVVMDEELFRTLPARIAMTRAYNAQAQGDFPGAVKYADLALDLSPEEDLFNRGGAAALLGLANWARGDMQAAQKAIADWANVMQKAGVIIFVIPSIGYLADIIVAQGRLHEAARTYKQSLQLASELDKPALQMTANVHLGLALIYHEQGNQEAAAQHLRKSRELGEQTALIDWPYRWCLAQARLRETWGDLEAALDLLDEAKRVYVRIPVPDIRPIEALKARVYARQGRLTKALDWVHERGLSVDDDLGYLREFEHTTLARVLIAEYKSNHAERSVLQAMRLLERLLEAAEEGKRPGSAIEILVLQALAHAAQGNIPLALAPLERALALAEPEGYVRIFVDEGPPIEALLKRMKVENGRLKDYVHKLLAAAGDKETQPFDSASRGMPVGQDTPSHLHGDHGESQAQVSRSPQPLIEPLSERELEVLRLIAEGLTNQEIASGLFLSHNTVKVHTRNIYGKLGAHNRTQAAARARELGILPSA